MAYAHVCNTQGAQKRTIRYKRNRWLIFRKLYLLIICTKLLYYCANDILFVQIKLFVQDLCSIEQKLCRIPDFCATLEHLCLKALRETCVSLCCVVRKSHRARAQKSLRLSIKKAQTLHSGWDLVMKTTIENLYKEIYIRISPAPLSSVWLLLPLLSRCGLPLQTRIVPDAVRIGSAAFHNRNIGSGRTYIPLPNE